MEIVLSIDQGTTGSQVAFFCAKDLSLIAHAKVEYPQHYPHPGFVEHDLNELWNSVVRAFELAVQKSGKSRAEIKKRIVAVGITNQRETTCAWNKKTGEVAARAIVWQDRRTADYCATLREDTSQREYIEHTTGLVVDPYFSATKMHWLLRHNAQVQLLAKSGELALGTIDSFLIFKLTGGTRFVSDHTNASRTMLYGLTHGAFDSELCKHFSITREWLPELVASSGELGRCKSCDFIPDGVPICGCLGDQQASLLGHGACTQGEGKITFGTGSFLLAPLTKRPSRTPTGLLCSVGYSTRNERSFVLEGSVFIAAAAFQFLRDRFGWYTDSAETEALAASVSRASGLIVVPAFSGLGAPYWNPHARGTILGLTLGTSKEQVIRATLEAVAIQNVALVEAMQQAIGQSITQWGVDGGASRNNFLMQFQSDVLQATLHRPLHSEMTALGAAKAALQGLGCPTPIKPATDRSFTPGMSRNDAKAIVDEWQQAAAALNRFYADNPGIA